MPLLKAAALHGENLENCYTSLLVKQFFKKHVVKCIAAVRGTMFYSSECWALRQEDKKHFECSERATLLWMCNIKKECVGRNSLLNRLKLKSLNSVLRCNRLHLFRHVKRSELYTRPILGLEV